MNLRFEIFVVFEPVLEGFFYFRVDCFLEFAFHMLDFRFKLGNYGLGAVHQRFLRYGYLVYVVDERVHRSYYVRLNLVRILIRFQFGYIFVNEIFELFGVGKQIEVGANRID